MGVRAIWGRVKEHGEVHVDSRGESSSANALRALAVASRESSRVLQFHASWVSDDSARWLRFHANAGQRWDVFKRDLGRLIPLSLSFSEPTEFMKLALAIKANQSQTETVTVDGLYGDDPAAYATCKALAELPRLCSGRSVTCVAGIPKHDAICVHVWIGRRLDQKHVDE